MVQGRGKKESLILPNHVESKNSRRKGIGIGSRVVNSNSSGFLSTSNQFTDRNSKSASAKSSWSTSLGQNQVVQWIWNNIQMLRNGDSQMRISLLKWFVFVAVILVLFLLNPAIVSTNSVAYPSADTQKSIKGSSNRATLDVDTRTAAPNSASTAEKSLNGTDSHGRIHIRQYERELIKSDEDVERARRAEEEVQKERDSKPIVLAKHVMKEMRVAEQTAKGETESIVSEEDKLTQGIANHYLFVPSGSGVKFNGLDFGLLNGVNVTKVSLALYKLIKSEKITSLTEYPCTSSADWMPHLLALLDFEIRGFRYVCVDSDASELERIKPLFTGAAVPEFVQIHLPTFNGFPPGTDLFYSWNGMQRDAQNGIKIAWSMIKAIRRNNYTWMLLGNSQGSDNFVNGKHVNLRNMPFSFANPERTIRNITNEAELGERFPMQLVLYKVGKEKPVPLDKRMKEARSESDKTSGGRVVIEEDEV
mmetsp:Transcript_3889/g.6789  ORF Transcript_3889/g.6789 Transcript_3889/m.6789 type:complete len:477 (-) Transcript_3889:1128-2558(-)